MNHCIVVKIVRKGFPKYPMNIEANKVPYLLKIKREGDSSIIYYAFSFFIHARELLIETGLTSDGLAPPATISISFMFSIT